MKNEPKNYKLQSCSLCGQTNLPVSPCEGGYVCEPCTEQTRLGRDNTTQAVKTLQRSMRGQSRSSRAQFSGEVIDEQLEYDIESSGLLAADALAHISSAANFSGGEVLPQHDTLLRDTLAAPGATALDASANRLELITRMGTDVAAMALDASDTIGATNSLEKMLAHQLAVSHEVAMRYVSKASLEQDPAHSVRMMNLATRSMETFQKGLLTLKRLRGTGEQRITIQHVNVRDGGQAVISQLNPGGGGTK